MSARNLLLANICLSNLIIAFLVKPISAVYLSYSLTTGEGSVGLAFCSLYTLSSRTTWLVLPLTTVALCWTALAHRFPCCRGSAAAAAPRVQTQLARWEGGQVTQFPTIRQKCVLGAIWLTAAMYGLTFCFHEKVSIYHLSI